MNGANEVRTGAPTPAPPLGATERRQFWGDTCNDVTQMRNVNQRVIELYQKYGCRFIAPSPQQVQDVLQALDTALPDWEKTHPELFFQTLELNYPELLRRP